VDPPLRVLFIGDGGSVGRIGAAGYSHNEMYRLFRLVAAAGLKRRVVVGQVTRGAMTPIWLWHNTPASHLVLRALPWDYVALDDWKEKDPVPFAEALRLFDQVAKAKTPSTRLVVSVGTADRLAVARPLNAVLLPAVGAHQSPDLMYRGALMYYRAMTGLPTLGLPAPPVQVEPDSTVTLTPPVVERLQRGVDSMPFPR
jgi:hypothetical protein